MMTQQIPGVTLAEHDLFIGQDLTSVQTILTTEPVRFAEHQ